MSKMPTKEEMAHALPTGFLDAPGMCILPSFYQPETEDLRWATDFNIRKTLFFSVFRSVKYVEFKRLVDQEKDFFELESIEPLENGEGWIDKFVEKYISKEATRGKLL
mgnify:CR=1 FL=1